MTPKHKMLLMFHVSCCVLLKTGDGCKMCLLGTMRTANNKCSPCFQLWCKVCSVSPIWNSPHSTQSTRYTAFLRLQFLFLIKTFGHIPIRHFFLHHRVFNSIICFGVFCSKQNWFWRGALVVSLHFWFCIQDCSSIYGS